MILAILFFVGLVVGIYVADLFMGDVSCEYITPAPRGGMDE